MCSFDEYLIQNMHAFLFVGLILTGILVPALACVNNTLWVAEASCLNCTNTSTNYQCFDLTEAIDDGIISTTWYSDLHVLNTTSNHTSPYCYDNDNTERVCAYNLNTSLTIDEWTFDLRSIDTNGTNFSSCGFTMGNWPEPNYVKCKNITLGLNFTTDETIYLNVTYDSDMLASMIDIKFYDTSCDNNGNELSYDIEAVVTSTNGEYHVLPNQNFTAGDIISMYYSYAGAGDNTDAATVWAGCDVVYYFEETSGTTIIDRSGNGNNGTLVTTGGVTMGDTGLLGKGLTVRPGSYVSIPNTDFKSDTQGSVLQFIKLHQLGIYQDNFASTYGSGASTERLAQQVLNTNVCAAYAWPGVSADWERYSSALKTGEWYMQEMEVNSTGNRAYVNVTLSPINSGDSADTHWFSSLNAGQVTYINRLWYASAYYSRGNFTISHFRICNSPHSPDWINTTFENIYNHDSYITFGTEQNITALDTGCEGANCTIWTPNITQSYGLYTADLFFEEDNTAWDMGASTDENITFTCVASQSIEPLLSNADNTFILYDTPRVVKVDLNFTATGDEYYRKQVPTCTFPCIETQNFYLVNLNVSDLVELSLNLQDWTGLYGASEIRIKRPILTSGIIQVTSDLFDAENKAIFYLIKDMEYQLEVYKNGIARNIGYLIIDSDTTKYITIADVEYDTTETRLYEDILMGADIDLTYITGYYNDTSNTTTNPVYFNVYNVTSGSLLYTTNSVCQYCTFMYDYLGAYSTPFMVMMYTTNDDLGLLNNTWYFNYYNDTAYEGEGTIPRSTYNAVSIIILLGVASMAGALYVPAGAIAFILTAVLLKAMNWLSTPSLFISLGILMALAISVVTKKGDNS